MLRTRTAKRTNCGLHANAPIRHTFQTGSLLVSNKHLTCALAIAAICLVAPANAAVVEPDYGSPPPCDHTRTRAVVRLEELVAAVQTGAGAKVSAVLDRDW